VNEEDEPLSGCESTLSSTLIMLSPYIAI